MTTHAAAGKQWTEEQLGELTVENGFRLRGMETTRLDTFVDAAFAFVLTLLVISFDEIPANHAEMVDAAKRIPGFAMSFATLMMFWLQHRRWSRRYGLENLNTLLVSLVLIFVMMVYVYPLRILFEGMFASLSGGYFPTSFVIRSYEELRYMFLFYSAGFLALSVLVAQLYREAARNTEPLGLNELERRKTIIDLRTWAIFAALGLVSIVLALTLPDRLIQLSGYIYFALFPASRIPVYLDRRGPRPRPSG